MRIRDRRKAANGHDPHTCEPAFAVVLDLVPVGVVEHLARDVGAVEGRIRHDTHRSGRLARHRVARQAMRHLGAVDELALGYAGAHGEQQQELVVAGSRQRETTPRRARDPTTVGSTGTPSSRAEPST